jgi:phosphohistidine phosphatase
MTIYVVRHGDAVGSDVDPERPLSERGRDEIREVAAFLEGAGVRVPRVIHSGKTRAAQTAEILAASVSPGVTPEPKDGLRPDDPVEIWTERLEHEAEDVMIVGHLPFAGRLVAMLTSGSTDGPTVAFDAGTVVRLDREAGGEWTIAWSVGPRQV